MLRRILCLFIGLALLMPVGAGAAGAGVTVAFDVNGGEGATPEAIAANAEGKLGEIPDGSGLSRPGYEFMGWYLTLPGAGFFAPETHPIVTGDTVFEADTTLYAAWQAQPVFIEVSDGDAAVTLGITAASKLLDESGSPIEDISEYLKGGASPAPIFKDLNASGSLDPYEDWRLGVADRVDNLVALLAASENAMEKIAGLMLYSSHQMVPDPYISAAQNTFLTEDYLRHVLVMSIDNPVDAARWNNNVQAYLESVSDDFGIPANNSSDPRHGASSLATAEYSSSTSGISAWPSSLGISATFDPEVMLTFGKIASTEYRLMGIATALSPQIDIATDPRWSRFNGTFGEDPLLASDMAAGYVRGFQSTYSLDSEGSFGEEQEGGWGEYSVNAMIKHWPGGGAGEGGQDAHYAYGKYAVYPGGNFNAHLIPFVDGAFDAGPTGKATAVMPYYTISYLQVPGSEPNSVDTEGAKLNMANAYSDYMINYLLRSQYQFDGVVCTDWNVIGPTLAPTESMFGPTPGMIWGVDDHYPEHAGFDREDREARADMLLRAGVNQFGGLNSIEPIMDAYSADTEGIEPFMLDSARVLLKNIFMPGLFENPYVDIEAAQALLGHEKFVEAGYQAQLDSMVLLKNKGDVLPLAEGAKVYVPGAAEGRETGATVSPELLSLIQTYFGADNVITDPAKASEADVALVFASSLISGGGSYNADGTINYTPAGLDYKGYTADNARETSYAGEPLRDEAGGFLGRSNNSYLGKAADPFADIPGFFGSSPSTLPNLLEDLKLAEESGIKTVVSLTLSNPMVLEDIEPLADAILVDFENQKSAVLDMLFGKTMNMGGGSAAQIAPRGMLPMQMPKDMQAVEAQYEDVPRDMECYTDSEGNVWDFGFGLTYGSAEPLAVPGNYLGAPMTEPTNPDGAAAIAERIRVCFDYDGDGEPDFIKIVKNGEPATDIVDPIPENEGKTLSWVLGETPYDFSAPVTEDILLTAQWN